MGRVVAPVEEHGPQPGEMIPDFFGRAADGQVVYRREFKGRRHLVLCFVAPLGEGARRALLDGVVARHAAFRAAGAEVVIFRGDDQDDATASPCLVLADPDERMHARYGATVTPLLIAADRYGEVVACRALDDIPAALDEALAAVEWMQTRCSL